MCPTISTIEPHFRTIDGLSIRFAESQSRGDDALLLCPWPESLFAFEQMWGRLAEQAHLVAIDLPGFGHSERRNPLMSPKAMGGFIARAADAFELEEPHVVGPDIGTGALLFGAALQPERWRSLVVGGGAAAFPLQLGPPLTDWIRAPDVDELKKVDPRQLVAGALSAMERYDIPPDIREDYLSAYEGDRFVESMRLYAPTQRTSRFCATSCLRWRRPCRSSPAEMTLPYRGSMLSFSTTEPRTASWTSSMPDTLFGKTQPTSTRLSLPAGGTVASPPWVLPNRPHRAHRQGERHGSRRGY